MAAKANILVIDDDANTLASLARAFRLAGHDATVCDSAARALELAKADRFDLSEVFLEIALVITSITLLSGRRIFWHLGLLMATGGVVLAASAWLVH